MSTTGLAAPARALILAAALLGAAPAAAAAAAPRPALVPAPLSLSEQPGVFGLRAATPVLVRAGDLEARAAAEQLADLLARTRGLKLEIREVEAGEGRTGGPAIRFWRAPVDGGPEAYDLSVGPDGATVSANAAAGFLYGAGTLWQLATQTPGRATRVDLPAVRIHDAPRFPWRGLMLDSARNFQSPEFVKRLIDVMATHKLNVLHWHLVDDQGWRLQIRKYPRLTEVGAWRVPAGDGPAKDLDPQTGKPRRTGGFYTQAEVREIVAYAQARNVTIVPEIEMPGHALAAIAAYPELGSTANPPTAPGSDWGVYPWLYNTDEHTFAFLEDVLSEVIELFPGAYVHVGGDEAVKAQWKASPAVQARMRSLGIADEDRLQGWFVARIGAFLSAHGRRLIGWDEILEGGVPADATVMSWRGVDGAVAAAKAGHDTVLAAAPTLYFDNRQSDDPREPPGRGKVVSVEDVYAFDPTPAGLTPEQRGRILGLQGQVWTEHVRTEPRAERAAFPREAAVAELGWSPAASHDFKDFTRRLAVEMDRYRALGWNAADSAFAPRVEAERTDAGARVRLSSQTGFGTIRYTTDGSAPSPRSRAFAGPIATRLPVTVNAATFDGRRQVSSTVTRRLDVAALETRDNRELKLCSEAISLALEDDAPVRGDRAVMLVDIMNPCWIWPAADTSRLKTVSVTVGALPFNFQIGDDVKKIALPTPRTPDGELEVRLDGCGGEPVAVLPLKPATESDGLTELSAPVAPRPGRHDLCFTFTRARVDPIRAIGAVRLIDAEGVGGGGR
jgi:hexosaminidase